VSDQVVTTMSASSTSNPYKNDDASLLLFVGMIALSIGAHVIGLFVLPDALARAAPRQRVEMEFYEPPPPPKVEEPKKEEPPKPLEVVKVKPPPVKLAEKVPPPKEDLPPPPNDAPPPETPNKPVPIIVGISMSSTTAAGGFAVQVGNTTYGKTSDKITDPSQVKAYNAPKYAPPGGADTEPVIMGEVKIPYPDEAKKNEIEGSVRLKVTLDPAGTVTDVAVISGPGYGLNEAAREALKKFRFKPATKGGEQVGYTFVYTYTFLLD
jgi:periplasmic protein TonB